MNAGLTAACVYTTQHAHARHLFHFLQLHSVVLSLFSQSQVRAESNEELQTFRSERTHLTPSHPAAGPHNRIHVQGPHRPCRGGGR